MLKKVCGGGGSWIRPLNSFLTHNASFHQVMWSEFCQISDKQTNTDKHRTLADVENTEQWVKVQLWHSSGGMFICWVTHVFLCHWLSHSQSHNHGHALTHTTPRCPAHVHTLFHLWNLRAQTECLFMLSVTWPIGLILPVWDRVCVCVCVVQQWKLFTPYFTGIPTHEVWKCVCVCVCVCVGLHTLLLSILPLCTSIHCSQHSPTLKQQTRWELFCFIYFVNRTTRKTHKHKVNYKVVVFSNLLLRCS